METDPFLSVQSDVQALLQSTRHLFSSYLRIRSLSASKPRGTPSAELLQSQTELTENLETLTADIADLLESIRAIEADPYRFGLDVSEVARRKTFVRDVTREVDSMRKQIQAQTQTQSQGTSRGSHLPDPDAFGRDDDEENDAYAEFEQAQQQEMMREQDEALDGVFHTVGNLRGQAEDMGRELEEQGQMLGDIDTLADRVGGKLAVGTKRIGEVIRRGEDKYSGCCIGGLIAVLIILLILVIVI